MRDPLILTQSLSTLFWINGLIITGLKLWISSLIIPLSLSPCLDLEIRYSLSLSLCDLPRSREKHYWKGGAHFAHPRTLACLPLFLCSSLWVSSSRFTNMALTVTDWAEKLFNFFSSVYCSSETCILKARAWTCTFAFLFHGESCTSFAVDNGLSPRGRLRCAHIFNEAHTQVLRRSQGVVGVEAWWKLFGEDVAEEEQLRVFSAASERRREPEEDEARVKVRLLVSVGRKPDALLWERFWLVSKISQCLVR